MPKARSTRSKNGTRTLAGPRSSRGQGNTMDMVAAPLRANDAGFGELRLDAVRRGFGGTVALAGLSITIQRGEFVTLLGPSGCGKSTALNCIAGLLSLTGGSIWLD